VLRKRLQAYIIDTLPDQARITFDLESLDDGQIEAALLEIAGEIWSLLMFSNKDTSVMARSLVEPYTSPPDIMTRGC